VSLTVSTATASATLTCDPVTGLPQRIGVGGSWALVTSDLIAPDLVRSGTGAAAAGATARRRWPQGRQR
jgi:hypothetical protein